MTAGISLIPGKTGGHRPPLQFFLVDISHTVIYIPLYAWHEREDEIDKGSYIDERVCLINPTRLRPSFLFDKTVAVAILLEFPSFGVWFATNKCFVVPKQHRFVAKPHEFVAKPHEFVTKQHSFLTKKLGFLEKHLQTSAPRSGSRI